MKKHLSYSLMIFLILGTFLMTSCGDDNENSGPDYDFIDQNLQGRIDGLEYVFDEGRAEESFFTNGSLSIDLFDVSEVITEDICDFGFGDEIQVTFEIPDETGLFELSFDLSSFDGLVVNLLNPDGEDGIPQNNLASIGAVEILEISESSVSGRIDARLDSDNQVNGNFTAIYCPDN